MDRCEHDNLVWPADRPFPTGDSPYCHLCWVRARAGQPTPPPTAACRLLGLPLTDEEKADRDLYQLRDWRWCEHPQRPLGEAVCRCSGCGAGCSGYQATQGSSG